MTVEGPLITKLRFAAEDPIFEHEVPYELFGHPDQPEERITNCTYITHEGIEVADVRQSKEHFSLETNGFVYTKHRTAVPLDVEHFIRVEGQYSTNEVVEAYLMETITFLKHFLGVEKVICFDWRFRRSSGPPGSETFSDLDDVVEIRLAPVAPGLDAHCDFSQRGGMERLEMHLRPEEMELLLSGKYRAKIINTWRPFRTVQNAPLVISDRRTVQPSDVMEVEKIIPDKIERAYYLFRRPHTKWFYMSGQTEEDVAIFTTWDSEEREDGIGAPPHGAASDFEFKENPRESLEVRLIVLFPTENTE